MHPTGAAGVMVGRAAQGKPWLCGQIAAHLAGEPVVAVPASQQLAILRRHLQAVHEFYGDFMGVRIARKHVGWYLQDQPDYRLRRTAFNSLQTPAEQLQQIDQLFNTDCNEELAA